MFVRVSGSKYQLGGKSHALALLSRDHLPIPAWFALSPEAFEHSLSAVQQAAIAAGDVDEIRSILKELKPSPAIIAEINAALQQFPNGSRYAVRSSALEEDSGNYSFAGQLDSYLFVRAEAIPERVADVWRSGFNGRVVAYRRNQRLTPVSGIAPAVIIQRMVDADKSGVAFTADPVTGRRNVAVVSAVFGLGTVLVSGESDADVYEVDRSNKVLRVSIASKQSKHSYDESGADGYAVSQVAADEQKLRVLSDEQACAIAGLARRVERRLGRPQDIEWAIEGDNLYLLQARPITTLRQLPDPDAQLSIWDNSNISESYGGITTPLTFSFARAAYEGVYREFCRLLAVPESSISSHEHTFHNMLGLIRGRVYYNLLNWYRVLALLPGFKDNRRFFEQMLGIKQILQVDPERPNLERSFGKWLRSKWRLAFPLAAVIWNYFMSCRRTKEFYARLTAALEPAPALDGMRAEELAQHYCNLISKLIAQWDAPVLNDFFAMIFHGWLRRLSSQWFAGADELANELVRASGAMISVEPAVQINALAAEIASHHPALIQTLRGGEPEEALLALRQVPELGKKYDEYLARFGDRCVGELKLESPTLHDDPASLLRTLGELARAKAAGQGNKPPAEESYASAMRTAALRLRWHPIRRLIFHCILSNARRCICQRENLRFERTRVFGRVRRIFVEIGRRFYETDLLEEPRDIFYLQVEEILAFIHGTAVTTNLKDLVALRKRELDEIREQPAPADRFETRGPVYQGNSFQSQASTEDPNGAGEERVGLGCCPGKVRGRVRLVANPRDASMASGHILVAERTDPGWIVLFPMAAGLIVERGSLLSHSAIVSRELGIPCVVSLRGATQWLRDGDLVELDGAKGVVRRVGEEDSKAASRSQMNEASSKFEPPSGLGQAANQAI